MIAYRDSYRAVLSAKSLMRDIMSRCDVANAADKRCSSGVAGWKIIKHWSQSCDYHHGIIIIIISSSSRPADDEWWHHYLVTSWTQVAIQQAVLLMLTPTCALLNRELSCNTGKLQYRCKQLQLRHRPTHVNNTRDDIANFITLTQRPLQADVK